MEQIREIPSETTIEEWKKEQAVKPDGKFKYQFEWNDLRCLITVVNVILIMIYGLQIAWFGLSVAAFGIVKDLTEIPSKRFRFSSLIMHLANVGLNIFFLCQL